MNKLFHMRFNIIDLIGTSTVSIYLSRGQFVVALVASVIGVVLSLVLDGVFKLHAMNQQWQQLADAEQLVPAVKKHRELFGSSLKDAHHAVMEYKRRLKA